MTMYHYKDYHFHIMSAIVFAISYLCVQAIIASNSVRWSNAPTVAKVNNICYGICSGLFSAWAAMIWHSEGNWKENSMHELYCGVVPSTLDWMLKIYYYSKYWESIDLILVMLMGHPINLHFRIHHCTTPILGAVILTFRPASGLTFMILNTFTHFWIYIYHGGWQSRAVFNMIRITGHLQLVVGLCCAGMSLHSQHCDMEMLGSMTSCRGKGNVFSEELQIVLYTIYLLLLRKEVNDTEKAELKASGHAVNVEKSPIKQE